MITMHDIAKKAGVSTATVSRVLNNRNASIPISEKTQKRVLAIAEELGYTPNMYAKTLRTNRSMLIGVVVWDLTDFFYSDILRGIENTLHPSGYNLLLNSAEGDEERERISLEKMRDLHVDGILLVGGSKASCKRHLTDLGIDLSTVVLVGTTAEDLNVSSVAVDNFTGGYIGMEYLLSLDRRKLVYIAGHHKTTDMEDRLRGVERAVADNFAGDSVLVRNTGPGEQAGYDAVRSFLAEFDLPVGIFAVSDLTALGAIRAVKEMDLRIPEDVAVLGFDDLSMTTFFHPSLSTIHQPRYEMGEMGAKILLEGITWKNETTPGGNRSPGAGGTSGGAPPHGTAEVLNAAPGSGSAASGSDGMQSAAPASRQIQLSPELVLRESS